VPANTAAAMGAVIVQNLPEPLPHSESIITYASPTRRPAEDRKPPDPISLSWFTTDFGTCSVRMKSQVFPNGPEAVRNLFKFFPGF